jgi:hypothetical protein
MNANERELITANSLIADLRSFAAFLCVSASLREKLNCRGQRVTALDQFGGDADGDFARLVGAQWQADGAAEGVGAFVIETRFGQFADQNFALCLAADDAKVGKLESSGPLSLWERVRVRVLRMNG